METASDRIAAAVARNAQEPRMAQLHERWKPIAARVPGWSGNLHYLFFQAVLEACPEIKSVLMLGVYMGRDISIILDCAAGRPLQIVGVDRFKDTPCEDWAAEQKTMSWTEAGFGPPPDIKKALENINAQPPHAVKLVEAESQVFLAAAKGKVDWVYVDTSHEEKTVREELELIRPMCHEHTIISGDDYTNEGKDWWGVDKAVKGAFKNHQVLMNMIWWAGAEDFK